MPYLILGIEARALQNNSSGGINILEKAHMVIRYLYGGEVKMSKMCSVSQVAYSLTRTRLHKKYVKLNRNRME